MGKLMIRLEKQLKTHYKKDAEDCIKIHNKLKEMDNGYVWESKWTPLVDTIFEDYSKRRYKPTSLGEIFLKEIEKKSKENLTHDDITHALSYGYNSRRMGYTHAQALEEYKKLGII